MYRAERQTYEVGRTYWLKWKKEGEKFNRFHDDENDIFIFSSLMNALLLPFLIFFPFFAKFASKK